MRIGEIIARQTVLAGRPRLLVKVVSDDGTFGWGESGLTGRETAVAAVIDAVTPQLIGRSVHDAEWIARIVLDQVYMEGGRVSAAALSAIDIALCDLRGKLLGLPLHALLGGRFRMRVPLFLSVALDDPEAALQEVAARVEDGWYAFRLMVCRSDETDGSVFEPRREAVRLANICGDVRRVIGREPLLGIDLHHRFMPPDAERFLSLLAPGVLDFVEEPIRANSPEAYIRMRRHGGLRLAVGEEFSSVQEFSAFLNAGVIDYARVDIALVGGFGAARRVAALCEAQNIPLMPHNPLAPVGFAALLHYATATPNLACVELQMANDVSPDLDAVFLLRPRPDKGFAVAGDAPGLGIEIDEASLPGPGHWRAPILEADDGGPVPW